MQLKTLWRLFSRSSFMWPKMLWLRYYLHFIHYNWQTRSFVLKFLCCCADFKWGKPMLKCSVGKIWSFQMSCCMYKYLTLLCIIFASFLLIAIYNTFGLMVFGSNTGYSTFIGQWWWEDTCCVYQLFDKGISYMHLVLLFYYFPVIWMT